VPVYPVIRSIDFRARNLSAPDSVCHLVNVLSLPREVILALWTRVEPPGATVAKASSVLR
jgi:hypothetical protein